MEKFSKEPQIIKNMFNQIAPDYDKLNNIMSFGLHKFIKKNVLKNLAIDNNSKILDLCTGSGDLVGILKNNYPDSKIIGIDFSDEMLNLAKIKYPEIEFLNTDCEELPFKNEQFDLCVISFGLRNIKNMDKTLNEIYRVLKKGGIFINLDLGKPPKFLNIFFKPYMFFWVSLMGKFFHGDKTPYQYLAVSNENFPSQKQLVKIFQEIGFFEVKNKNYLFGQIASQRCKK
jgi:demethylmenaquinone methyltransferase/2-methoxy-6-polyprenyl-1,4-benzoquinol methylase